MTEFAWVVEHAESEPSRPLYWIGGSLWSPDSLAAVRLSRKEDAEHVCLFLPRIGHRIAEHGWG